MNIYKRHRFPPEIIQFAVWLYYRFNLSHRDIEDLLAQRGITVSHEAILYIAMWSAIQYDPKIKAMYERLVTAGKPKKVALVECMRKQFPTILKNGTHWDEKLARNLDSDTYPTREAAKSDVFNYIELFYNPTTPWK